MKQNVIQDVICDSTFHPLVSVLCSLCVQTYVKLMKKQQKELSSLKKKHVKVGGWGDPGGT